MYKINFSAMVVITYLIMGIVFVASCGSKDDKGGPGCIGTAITTYIQVDNGSKSMTSEVTVNTGSTISFTPQPASSGGSWEWTGPNGFTATSPEITITNVQLAMAGDYVATYTNTKKCKSDSKFTLTVLEPVVAGNPTEGFTIEGTHLRDANGNNFIMKGFSVPTAWFVNDVNSNIASIRTKTGANCLRIVVNLTSSDASWQTSVTNCIANKMIPMVELHDVTGNNSATELNKMAQFWASKASFLTRADISRYILINIANEWGDWFMSATATGSISRVTWRDAYITAVSTIRNAGIKTTLVIDAAGYGQDNKGQTILEYAKEVQASDTYHNCLFSVHMYCEWKVNGNSSITSVLPSIKNAGIPIIVGEFGYQHTEGNGTCDINESEIIKTSNSNGIGWLAWSWKGNGGGVEYLDLSTDWAGDNLSAWGNTVVNGAGGTKTAVVASVFN